MKSFVSLIILCSFLFICIGCNKNELNEWKTDSPNNHGIDTAAIETVYNEIINNANILSFLVTKDGYLVSEYYADKYNKNSVFAFNSCAKSVTSAVYGIALDKGLVGGVETKVTDYFPQFTGDKKEEIKIGQLLDLTCGLHWPEFSTWNYRFDEWVQSKNWVNYILDRNIVSTPGDRFNYNTGAVHLLSYIIQKETGMTEHAFAKKNLFDKIGMSSVKWDRDPQRVTTGGFGIYMTSRDAAKFGQLYANKGKWGDEQIISEEWINISTSKHSDGYPYFSSYGYLWWVDKIRIDDEHDMFYAMGYAGQYILVIPDFNLVAVFTSKFQSSGTSTPISYFKRYVIAGITDY